MTRRGGEQSCGMYTRGETKEKPNHLLTGLEGNAVVKLSEKDTQIIAIRVTVGLLRLNLEGEEAYIKVQ